MRKKISAFAVMLCCILASTCFLSCSSEDDETTMYTYRAEGNISGTSIASLFLITDYTAAIQNVIGESYTTSNKDKDVIAACDAVYAKHQQSTIKASGQITIKRYTIGKDDQGTAIKTYDY